VAVEVGPLGLALLLHPRNTAPASATRRRLPPGLTAGELCLDGRAASRIVAPVLSAPRSRSELMPISVGARPLYRARARRVEPTGFGPPSWLEATIDESPAEQARSALDNAGAGDTDPLGGREAG